MVSKNGYTLAEIIVALTIFALISGSVALLYGRGYASYARQSQRIDVLENLRIAVNRVSREIRQALPVRELSSQTKASIKSILGRDPTEPVNLMNNGEKIIFVIDDQGQQKIISYYYDSAGKEIQRSVNGAGNNPVASNVTGLKFSYSNSTVTITVRGEKRNSGEVLLRTRVRVMAL